ncbi:MAG TPA: YXWGXW repeat-containing protein [Mucilaginibacter sp.]|jgi:hypothetical protein
MKNLIRIFLLLGVTLFVSPAADAQVSLGISVRIAPPPLPVYEQPECPVDGWLWQPGYWAYEPGEGYYWVPGVWVAPPRPGLLWTPSYWGFDNGVYLFHSGYWGPHVGFYGGINYGFGYPGYGFYGGVWSGRSFRYNTAVFRVNRSVVRNVYINRVHFRPTASRASFNGRGGIMARPGPQDRRAMNEHHFQPTRTQLSHQRMAERNPAQRLSTNHGRPATPAMHRVNNHFNSSPVHRSSRPVVHRSNPAVNHNTAPGHNRETFKHTAPQVNHSNPQHRDINRKQHIQPQRAPHAMQHSNRSRQMQPQRVQQPNTLRPQQSHQMRPQRMPQPQRPVQQHGRGGDGGQHAGGGHDGGGHGRGHRP